MGTTVLHIDLSDAVRRELDRINKKLLSHIEEKYFVCHDDLGRPIYNYGRASFCSFSQ